MSTMEEMKSERSSAKKAVTLASNRVIGAVERGTDFDVLKGLMTDLEKVYNDFITVNIEYADAVSSEEGAEHRVVGGLDLNSYEEAVMRRYEDAKASFMTAKLEEQDTKNKVLAEPIRRTLFTHLDRLKTSSKNISEMVKVGKTNNVKSVLKDDVAPMVDTIIKYMSELSCLQKPELFKDIQDEVDRVMHDLDNLKSDVYNGNVTLGENGFNHLPNSTAVHSGTNGVNIEVSQPFNSSAMSYGSNVATSSQPFNSLVQGGYGSNVAFASQPLNVLTKSCSSNVSDQNNRSNLIYSSVYSGQTLPLPSSGAITKNVFSPNMGFSSSGNFLPGSSGMEVYGTNQVQSRVLADNINTTVNLGVDRGTGNNYGFSSSTPYINQFSQAPLDNPHTFGPNISSTTYNKYTSQTPGYNTNIHMDNIGCPPQAYSTPVLPRNFVNDQLKKIPLPEFSGQRKDWPEFKCIWRELAEQTISNPAALAYELKRSLKGQARERIKNVYITKPQAYEIMWRKLCEYYDDASAGVQSVLESLNCLKPVREENYKGIVHIVDEIEGAYNQLEEMDHLDVLTMRDVDRLSGLFPTTIKMAWVHLYQDLTVSEKLKPMVAFMSFLEKQRVALLRLADIQPKPREKSNLYYGTGTEAKLASKSKNFNHKGTDSRINQKGTDSRSYNVFCVMPQHKNINPTHSTASCSDFRNLSLEDKYKMLKEAQSCYKCFGSHYRIKCRSNIPCKICHKHSHHTILCQRHKINIEEKDEIPVDTNTTESENRQAETNTVKNSATSLYPIHRAWCVNGGKYITVFCDGGSNSTYITHKAAGKINAKKLNNITLDVTTMGNVETSYNTCQYEVSLRTNSGKVMPIVAYGMNKITGPVHRLDATVLSNLFPEYDPSILQRSSTTVDILLGCDYYGLHPKNELCSVGENLSVMSGELGICVVGTHPDLNEETTLDSSMAIAIHEVRVKVSVHHSNSHPEFLNIKHLMLSDDKLFCDNNSKCNINIRESNLSRAGKEKIDTFILGEELGTQITPQCGGCKCSKCPTVGHTYSFREEQEIRLIRNNLKYNDEEKCWITSYPWLIDPKNLPNSYGVALATLKNTERRLKQDKEWAKKYSEQIDDMVNRGVASKLTGKELTEWDGPVFYLSHLAVVNPHSKSTPVRIVFNSSQNIQGVSLNSFLAKGPDCYLNNLLGLLLRWREENVAVVGDIRKMFNTVHIEPLEQHCHRFLWRDLDETKKPETYMIKRVNMGDRPAPAISTEALYKTSEMFKNDYPRAATLLKKSSYVDDLIDSFSNLDDALNVIKETEKLLSEASFKIKCWQFSHEKGVRLSTDSATQMDETPKNENISMLKGSEESTRVLGLGWNTEKDMIIFRVTLNFSKKKSGIRQAPNLTLAEIPNGIPQILTRRIVLEQTMSIFDPLGLLSPFTLFAKINLRETWTLKLGWDDPLPRGMRMKWIQFFSQLFELEDLQFNRNLHPANAVGKPWLIILGDGSDIAYGFAAYIRWKLDDGNYWCRLIMSKCRIAPMNKLSTPQMELNAAVLSKRGRRVIEEEMRFDFEKILHIVDSATVLAMINKISTRFKVYEGVRIGEIQTATNGDMSCWAWMSGKNNTADWLTRGRSPKELNQSSEWWNGPDIFYQPIDMWGLKYSTNTDEILPGEKKVSKTNTVTTVSPGKENLLIEYTRFGSVKKLYRVLARVISICRRKSFSGGNEKYINPDLLRSAEKAIVINVQRTISEEAEKGKKGKYSGLNPIENHGIWVIGQRLQRYNPMTPDSDPQMLLPYHHPFTRIAMRDAHCESLHRGRDGTLARFRHKFWTPHGSKLSASIKNECQLCKRREITFLKQSMGPLPDSRLKPAPPFNKTMVDMFGPYMIRSEVHKRTYGKAYGVIFTDLTMRAVHIEVVAGYDTNSFLMALSRFANIRGWPEIIYSDPGSQLTGAERELREVWMKFDKTLLTQKGTEKGVNWIFGPADSPWHQGAVESLVKSAKRGIHFVMGNKKLSMTEFLTVCTEVANMLNERPIGTLPGRDSEINAITPNSLLLGRSLASNPGEWQEPDSPYTSRFHLVQHITQSFWDKWVELCAPTLVVQRKWHTSNRNLKSGDVVILVDKGNFRGEYRLGLVKNAIEDCDGKVRKVTLTYKNYKVGEKNHIYKGANDTVITRAVQRLALLVPVDDST